MRNRIAPIVLLVCLAVPTLRRTSDAATQFDIRWYAHNHQGSCITPGISDGTPFFNVNELPIPTYTVPGSLTYGPAGEFNITYHAPFSGTVFRVGHNEIDFGSAVSGQPFCAASDDTVYLTPGNRMLFSLVSNHGTVEGAASINLGLREIDPNLANSLDLLKRAISDTSAELRRQAADVDALDAGLDSLQAELDQLFDLGFDEIVPAQLDALLDQFDWLPDSVRIPLVDYLRDLQKDVGELRAEISRIADVFAQRVSNVDGIGDGAPGFDPQDPGGFVPIATGEIPPIDIPAVLGDDPWSDAHDPYAQYADEVLTTLNATLHDGVIVKRATFLEINGAWRYNTDALENILVQRATVTVREWGAFLDAKGRVLSFLEQFIDHDGWMKDAPASPDLRAMIAFLKDLDVSYHFKQRAEALKLAINLWQRDTLTERQNALLDIMLLFDAAVRARMAQSAPEEQEDGFWNTMESIADTTIAVADVAISFTPVGHVLDLCRAITGRSLCAAGDQLSTAERVMYAASSVIGGGSVWKNAAIKLRGSAAVVARETGEALEQIVKRSPITGILEDQTIRHRGGAKTYFHTSGKSVRYSCYVARPEAVKSESRCTAVGRS
jgi:hypothetical protein